MRVVPNITVTETDRETPERRARGRSTPVRLMQRAQIVLAAALGRDNHGTAPESSSNSSTRSIAEPLQNWTST